MKNIYVLLFSVLSLVSCAEHPNTKQTAMSNDYVQLIRNATLKIQYGGKTILVDPLLSGKGELHSVIGVNRNPTVHLTMPIDSVMKDVDFTLVTHSHFDHFDKAAAQSIADKHTVYIQPADSTFYLNEYGMTNTEPVNNSKVIDGITIYRTGGEHGRGPIKEKMGEVSGFVLKKQGQPTIYIVGDCLWTEEIKQNIEHYKPEWVIINTGGAIIPALSKEYGTLIMNEKDVVAMIKESPSYCRFIAVHMDAIDHCQTTRSILRNEADFAGISKEKLLIPYDGEVIYLK